jgi:enamine deaminase RidA (YjgF/YER057c/UK114 family)
LKPAFKPIVIQSFFLLKEDRLSLVVAPVSRIESPPYILARKETVMEIDRKLAELGLELPTPPVPAAHYIPYVQVGNLLFVGGNTGRLNGQPHTYAGKVGDQVTLEQAYQMARHCALNHLAVIKSALEDLDRVERFVKLLGFVNVAPGFTKMPQVVNGASDLFIEIWGKRGEHARAAVGVASLANDAPVETEVIVQIKE